MKSVMCREPRLFVARDFILRPTTCGSEKTERQKKILQRILQNITKVIVSQRIKALRHRNRNLLLTCMQPAFPVLSIREATLTVLPHMS